MIFGFEIPLIISFLQQLGLAVAGAAALWGGVFVIYSDRKAKTSTTDGVVFRWLATRLFWLLVAGFIIAMGAWLMRAFGVYAHEGIVLVPTIEQTLSAFVLTQSLYILWAILTLFGFFVLWKKQAWLGLFFVLQFVLVSVMISFPAWTGEFGRHQAFFIGHNIHSIFTVGTVLVLDYLYLSSKSSLLLKQNIFSFFPVISKVIWVGLGFDFISVALVFNDAIMFTPKFFFMQTVVGILIINGAFLSGPMTRMMARTVSKEMKPLSRKQTFLADVCGTLSVTSWTTITFIDFFHDLPFTYGQFLLGYGVYILIAYTGHALWEYFDKEEPRLQVEG